MKNNVILFRVVLFLTISLYGCSTNNNNTTTVVPIAPSNLTASVISNTQVNLSWTDNATNESGYKIQRKTSGGSFADVGSTGADISTFTDLGLTPNTTYTYRVYAYNSAGNSLQYSNEVDVTTSANPGNQTSVTIGTQIWSSKNLDVDRYRNGDPIPQVTDLIQWNSLTTGAWCYYNNDPAMGAIYGKLYNWYAVNDPRGLAPTGWHVPTDAEWNKLVKHLDASADTVCQGSSVAGCEQSTIAGAALKSTTGWSNGNAGATNSTGFSGLPGGDRFDANPQFPNNAFQNVGDIGFWWSASQYSTYQAWARLMYSGVSSITRFYYSSKSYGYSVRVIKD